MTIESVPVASMTSVRLIEEVARRRAAATTDPFAHPVLAVALDLVARMEARELDEAAILGLVRTIGGEAVRDRAARLAAYVGLASEAETDTAYAALADRLAESVSGFETYRALVTRRLFAAVFTAHPTFGMARDLARRIAVAANGAEDAFEDVASFRPDAPITLDDEYAQAREAVVHARDALDRLNAALIEAARQHWPRRWTTLAPSCVTLASWVGSDTDGRTDIDWWDILRYRLRSKQGQLTRVLARLPDVPEAAPARTMTAAALAAVTRQLDASPPLGASPDVEALRGFALALVEGRETGLTQAAPLLALLEEAIAAASDDETRLAFCLVRAGCVSHGLSIALPHCRLNASQLHNALGDIVDVDGNPGEPAQRRAYLAAMNGALGRVETVPVDYGALAAERSSATRLVMTVAQLVKHVDGSRPVRFLVAETETGYTLLCALWLAKRFGVEDQIEIAPLFETSLALEQGPRIVDEALRSPHWRAYLKRHGRMVVQFGYSDSGRYVGQLAATFLVERLRLRICELLARYELTDVELVIFDTHGESTGRGAHPASLADRLAYLAPAQARAEFVEAGIKVGRETSFQGTDGYLLFASRGLAGATVLAIAKHNFPDEHLKATGDPIYDEPDFATEFFGTVRQEVEALVEDPGYAALIGTFGPGLLDKTGSRPAARQSDAGGPARITHPRELRAIPNNAILHQLGWLANSVFGLGRAAARAPEVFVRMRHESDRFSRAYGLAEGAMRAGDLDVLGAYVDTLDPGSWFDGARRSGAGTRRDEILAVADALTALDLAPRLKRLFGRLTQDWLALGAVAPDLPAMSDRLVALHAVRLAMVRRIWLCVVHIPDFRPVDGVTRDVLAQRVLRLDVTGAVAILVRAFPLKPDPTVGLDFGESPGPRGTRTYEALHRDLINPMQLRMDIVREITGVIQHELGAFG